ncbi:MAG: hypothetical protein IJZ95_01085 [Oscillospiraceae bacterium]|nr:hypothetical protein [Oscillospiraceae bacterium]
MLETVNDFGRKVTALFEAGKYCTFAPPEETLGIIDTSGARDGSRGIAFLCDEIRTNFSGTVYRIGYKQICSVTIIKSYETTFDDELQIDSPTGCIRITDCSLNKFFLRQLINSLCRIYYTMREDKLTQLHAECTARAMEHFAGDIPAVTVPVPAEQKIPNPLKEPAPEPQIVSIPDGKIEWISAEKSEDKNDSEENMVLPSSDAEVSVADNSVARSEEPITNNDDRLPDDMSREETMSYLLDSINEINSDEPISPHETEDMIDTDVSENEEASAQNTVAAIEEIQCENASEASEQPVEMSPGSSLTAEPESDDIYIKASRRLRSFCDEGRLSMEQIENAVKENMVSVAEMYSALSAEGEVPAIVAARAETLKNATDRLSEYFAMGEDIAARVMFFMLYQMLSYSDRIAELPETKERLNDFFRRYGPAGMALSLIDSGI